MREIYFLSDEEEDEPDDELEGVEELDVDFELSEEFEEDDDLESPLLESPDDFESPPFDSPLLEPPSFLDPFDDEAGPAPLPRA